ncbi:hypothetical protein Btru_077219 [Bulinus truncatus]|nr:hypothetical protein Btru_077219 [Bulinus truncatus]
MELFTEEPSQREYDADGRQIIDGSVLEGGGQILRIAAALSCILHIPIRVKNIRAGREKPGLKAQHMTGLQLVASLCNGKLDKCFIGSVEITLDPGPIQAGQFVADTKTAGSICLLMQVALPCLLYSSDVCTLQLHGGTNCDMAPQIDYLMLVFKPLAEKFEMHFNVDIRRRGYFPKGGGEVIVKSQPVKCLSSIVLTQTGELMKVYSRSFVAGNLPEHNLRVLHLQDNELRHVPSSFKYLNYYNVSKNHLTTFSVENIRNLVSLAASHNELEIPPRGLYKLKHLKFLYLDNNNLMELEDDMCGKLRHIAERKCGQGSNKDERAQQRHVPWQIQAKVKAE